MFEANNIPERLLTVKQVAETLRMSEQYVRELLRNGSISATKLPGGWVVPESALKGYFSAAGGPGPFDHPRSKSRQKASACALSFFSGAMGLDLGIEQAGIEVLLACEMDSACRKTIEANRPGLALLGDIWEYAAAEVRSRAGLGSNEEIDIVVGGPPCQAFSTAGARRGFRDTRGNVFLKYIELILDLRPRYAVIENVRGLLSAPMSHRPHAERCAEWAPESAEKPGGALLYVLDMLRSGGYGVSFNLYNAANFGVPQSRERVILICNRDGARVPHLFPTHSEDGSFGLPKWRTLRETLRGMGRVKHQYVTFPDNRLRFFRMLKSGQYWKHLPEELQREALGKSFFSGGGKTGFLRRLDWDKPSCTLVTSPNMPATDICHPVEDRPLSIQEYKRIQQFPEDWGLCGKLSDQYRQVGNAVPVGLGAAVGRAILGHIEGNPEEPPHGFPFSRYKGNDEVSWMASVAPAIRHDSRYPNAEQNRGPGQQMPFNF